MSGLIDQEFAESFAKDWIAVWNAHDLEGILHHYADEIVFLSPVAADVTGDGRIQGKAALRAYWRKGLERSPNLHFTLDRVYAGHNAVTLAYWSQRGEVIETMEFNAEGLVIRGYACYAPAAEQ